MASVKLHFQSKFNKIFKLLYFYFELIAQKRPHGAENRTNVENNAFFLQNYIHLKILFEFKIQWVESFVEFLQIFLANVTTSV